MKFDRSLLKKIGPGIAIAATGVGAGDLIAASVVGAQFGVTVLWAALVGAVMKYVLNEGVARWQLATGSTLLEGWIHKLHPAVSIYFLVYLVLWSFIVAGALISACGLAAHAMIPQLSVTTWGIIHSLAGVVLVLIGRYKLFETLIKFFAGLMVAAILTCAILLLPQIEFSKLFPSVPDGSAKFLLGVIGGVGGSVTLLSYSYWMREKCWTSHEDSSIVKIDLRIAYVLTGVFGMGMIIISAGVTPRILSGTSMVLEVGSRVGEVLGQVGLWIFLIGFWGAVFTSLFGVWQSVPYLFHDFMTHWRPHSTGSSLYYKGYLLYLAFPPMLLLFVGKPVWIVIIYTIAGAFFMPVLAGILLVMNNRSAWVDTSKNSLMVNILLALSLLLFLYLCVTEILDSV